MLRDARANEMQMIFICATKALSRKFYFDSKITKAVLLALTKFKANKILANQVVYA